MPDSKTRFGHIDMLDGLTVHGWAADLVSGQPASLLLLLDGHLLGSFTCNLPRADLGHLKLPNTECGFRVQLPDALADGRPHGLTIRFRSGEALTADVDGKLQEELTFTCYPTVIEGVVDGLTGLTVNGWVFRTDLRTGRRAGDVTVEVRANGVTLGQVKADRVRNDVAAVHGCEANCGYEFTLPQHLRSGRSFELEFRALPEGTQLGGSPFIGSAPTPESLDQLESMLATVESLSTEVFALRQKLRRLLATEDHGLDTYDGWARAYFDALRARVAAERRGPRYAELLGDKPKVSVICPAYKPDPAEFARAVASVRAQTWTDWELIIVDDGSRSAGLTARIKALCAADGRIRAVPQARNGGISAATNAGIAAANGEWVALFDHDDLLVDVALEVMLLAARNTGARVLYSDEDKVDAHGRFSEPHLKTDWNPRLLLAYNYVSHLLMVEAGTLREAGPLESRYNGAQDHDLVLRLSELVGGRAIHHVPEVLYHWRKTAGSTADSQAAKPYAAEAGRAAVADHLRRLGLPAEVSAPLGTTLYEVRWGFREEPKVAILIPFRDQAETTRRCVECILGNTAYRNYEIVLLDNWSTSPAVARLLAELASNARVRVMRMEEEFNFSRLNNRAAEQLDADFFLFLNNDVFVEQADWLRLLVDEALADPHVAAVGAKLVYPNGRVQHAGVVLGCGGVADHMFRFLPRDALGYFARAACAQDLSAVTAACMLCRADAFRTIGGFDAENLPVAFNDVDLCLRLRAAGHRVVVQPAVVAEHHESLSRGDDMAEHKRARFYAENQYMIARWGELLGFDPFYNPNFSRKAGVFEKLSAAPLDVTAAPSLLREPVPRAVLPPGGRAPAPSVPAKPPSRPAAAQARPRGVPPTRRPGPTARLG